MTPKEKAKQIFDKCMKTECCVITKEHSIPSIICDQITYKTAQKFALIAVDELIEATSIIYEYNSDFEIRITGKKPLQYWLDVKTEIEAL